MPSTIDRPGRWRALAAEALDFAKELTDPVAKQVMIAIAQKYAELAERAEERGEKSKPE